ncbi:MAG: penicillin-binding transpeptidase domain-containing protein, partial [Anaerolineales bacterium]
MSNETERNPSLHNNIPSWRIYFAAGAVGLVFLLFIAQLFNLQVVQGTRYVAAAEGNRTKEINIPAPRGIILDRNGTVLARNVASYNVVITASSLPDDEGSTQEVFRTLGSMIDMPINLNSLEQFPYVPCTEDLGIAQIAEYAETSEPYNEVRVKCNIDETTARILMEKSVDLPGISVEIDPIRDYPTGDLTANVVGYLGPIPAEFEDLYQEQGLVSNRDKVGYAGAELSLEDYLLGKNGRRTVEVDVGGQVLRDLLPPEAAVPGNNVRLTIDTRLQQAAQTILVQQIDALNRVSITGIRATSGVVVAINPKTGEILAMVSWPSYENNRMARLIPSYYLQQLESDGREPLLNHAIQAERPSGSVFKLVTAVGSLNEGVVTVDQVIDAPGVITLTEKYFANDPGKAKEFVDWNREQGGFGKITFTECIANSSNVCFYKLGGGYQDEIPEGLGVCRLGAYARAMGYGTASGIELPGEVDGLIPDPTWKRIFQGENWSTGDTYLASVGQGYVLATPLQVLMSASTIANDGKLMQPTIIREVLDGEGNVIQPFEPRMKWDVTEDAVVEEMAPTRSVGNSCRPTGEYKTVDPYVIEQVQVGMRGAVTHGTLAAEFEDVNIAAAGKTGTAEYCDNIAQSKNL